MLVYDILSPVFVIAATRIINLEGVVQEYPCSGCVLVIVRLFSSSKIKRRVWTRNPYLSNITGHVHSILRSTHCCLRPRPMAWLPIDGIRLWLIWLIWCTILSGRKDYSQVWVAATATSTKQKVQWCPFRYRTNGPQIFVKRILIDRKITFTHTSHGPIFK